MTNAYLKIIFFKRLSKYTDDNIFIASAFGQLFKNYTDIKRVYHHITHVIHLLKLLDEYALRINNNEVLYFAIWYHNAVFYARRNNSFELSAALAKEKLTKARLPAEMTEKIERYILAVKEYISDGTNDLNYFLDFDLSIYASDRTIYEVYVRQLREEWHFYPSFLLRARRKKFLSDLLEKNFIYNTEEFRTSSEKIARDNIRFELENY